MKLIASYLFLLLFISNSSAVQNPIELLARKRVILLMGTRFEFTAVAETIHLADLGIETGIKEVKRIEKLISSWDEDSQTSEINNNAGIKPVKVNIELYNLIERSLRISELTNGAFDISFASIGKLWKFDGTMNEPPLQKDIDASINYINYKKILLDPEKKTVFLKEKGMRIGFGAIGKGYAAEQAKRVMINLGIKNGVVSAAGDLIIWGKWEDGKIWDVVIAKPDKSRQVLAWLQVNESSVVTSGNYEKYFMHNGRRYSHIIDPRTGYPTTGIKSATIVCSNAELGDALATTMFVLGEEEGLILINQLKGIECLLITDGDKLISSNNLNIDYQAAKSATVTTSKY